MAQPAAVLSILVRANTGQAVSGLARVNSQLGATQGSANRALGALKTLAKGAAIGAAGGMAFAVKKAADFEQQLDSLGSVSGATGKDMERFRKQAMKAGADTKFSALDAAHAQTELAKGGLSVAQIMKGGLKSSLALAAAGEMDLAEAAETSANAIKLFGLRGKDSMKVADAFATAANKTTADVTDFAMALKQGGGVAKMAGLSFTETVLALEALAETGVRNSDAGTSMKTAFIQLLKPSAKQAELAKELGLNFINSAGSMKNMSQISEMLRGKLGGMTKAQRTAALATLAGTDGVRTLNALYSAGPAKLDKLRAGLEKTGTAAKVAADKQDNLKGRLENLQGSVETAAIAIGTKWLPTLTKAAEVVTDIINDPKLTGGEKFEKLAKLAGDAVAKATPGALNAAVKLGGKLAAGLGKGFVAFWYQANPLTKLLATGALIRLIGGPGALRATGAAVGRLLGGGIAAGTATAAVGGAGAGAAAGAGGGLLATMRGKLLPMAKRVGLIGVGIALADSVMSEFGRHAASKGPEIFGALKAKAGVFANANPLNALSRAFGAGGDEGAEKLRKQLQDIADTSKAISPAKAQQLRAELGKLGGVSAQAKAEFNALINGSVNKSKDLRLIQNEFGRLRSGAVLSVKELRQVTASNFRLIASTMGARSKEGRQAVTTNFRLGLQGIRGFMRDGTLSTKGGMREIKNLMVNNSIVGRQSVFKNFKQVENVIGGSMTNSKGVTRQGMAAIRKIMVNEMQGLGLSQMQIRMSLNKQESARKGFTQPGQSGMVVSGGKPTGDSVHALLERGEVVVNRKAVQKLGGPEKVNQLNQMVPRFAVGGIVGLGRQLQRQGFQVGEHPAFGGVDPVHTPGSYHYRGMALDVNADTMPGGEAKNLDRLYSRLKNMPGVVELLWRVAGHFNHLHVAMSGGGGRLGGLGAEIAKIARVTVDGPGGGLQDTVQRALDVGRSGAQKRLNQIAGSIEGSEPGVFSGGGNAAQNRALGKRMAAAAGWTGAQWKALDHLWGVDESGWDESVLNKAGSGAYGIAQALPSSKYPPAGQVGAPDGAAKAQAQIGWGLDYIRGRYGTPSVADAFRHAAGWYQGGGIVGMKKGGVAKQLNRTVNTLQGLTRKGKPFKPKQRSKQMKKLLGRISKVGLPTKLQNNLKGFEDKSALYGDLADRAGQLTVEPIDGGPAIPGVAKGKNETQWLELQLTELLKFRNAILKAEKIIVDRRERVAKLIEQAQKRLQAVSKQIQTAAKMRGVLAKQLEGAQKHPKRNKERIKRLKGQIKGIDGDQKRRVRARDGLKNRILPALTDKRSKFNTARGDLLTSLDEVQGPGGSMKVLAKLPEVGVLGGQIFDAQMRLRTLGEKPTVTDSSASTETDTGRTEMLSQLLRESNLRTAVSEKHFEVFKNMPPYGGQFATGGVVPGGDALMQLQTLVGKPAAEATMFTQLLRESNRGVEKHFDVFRDAPYGGEFAAGGVVPGPVGAPRMILAHGQETVTPVGGGGDTNVVLKFAPGTEWLRDFVKVEVERGTRRASRGRPLPGGGGGGLR